MTKSASIVWVVYVAAWYRFALAIPGVAPASSDAWQFWSAVVAAAIGALVGGGVAAIIAFTLFRAERNARKLEVAEERKSREHDRAMAEAERMRRIRGEAANTLMVAMRDRLVAGQPLWPTGSGGDIDAALMNLLLDGTDDSLTVNGWVLYKLGQLAVIDAQNTAAIERQMFEEIRAMLIAWVRDQPGAVVSMRRSLGDPPR